MVLEIGKKAPAFTLEDHNGKKVRLADLKGKWVILYFYPRMTPPGVRSKESNLPNSSPSSPNLAQRFMAYRAIRRRVIAISSKT
jgi:peroxiredoxin